MQDSYYKDAKKQAQKEFRACVARGEHPWLPRLDDFVTPERALHSADIGLVQLPNGIYRGNQERRAYAVFRA